jgi:deoxyribodipyrimidine photo-lyase
MVIKNDVSIFWHRRDLRNNDNTGLYYSLKNEKNVLPIFIFDSEILDKLKNKEDKRVSFIYNCIEQLKDNYKKNGSDIAVYFGKPIDIFNEISRKYKIKNVYTNYDYEPYAISRDSQIKDFLSSMNMEIHFYKDQTILDKDEVIKEDGKPYTVYTPYMKKYKSILKPEHYSEKNCEKYFANLQKELNFDLLEIEEMGFNKVEFEVPSKQVSKSLIKNYHNTRDFPYINGTSKISVHLRFGTISIRELFRICFSILEEEKNGDKYLNELIWRDFYMMILHHFPNVVTSAFKSKYDEIKWVNNEEHFKMWCEGKTGYPLVDAGMRQLNETGYMHNRVRMVVASFLTKHLLIDWRWGEQYFAEKLLDFELSSNNGGWQWASGSGCDAAPYFRVFNPELQRQKFDPDNIYIRKWVKELDTFNYPKPIIEHKIARDRAIKIYKTALESK